MVTASWRALGTTVVVGVEDAASLAGARAAVTAEVQALDAACSRFRADSEVRRLCRSGGARVPVSPLLAEAVRVALRAARLSDGDVDPTVGESLIAAGYDGDFATIAGGDELPAPRFRPAPGWRTVEIGGDPPSVRLQPGTVLDLGATAKALGADRAAAAAHLACGAGVIVALGGDVAVAGPAPAGGWPVRVAEDHAAPAGATAQHITLSVGGLATSSTALRSWRRGGMTLHHILDPRTGRPAEGPYRTVSVAAASCVDANIASTTALLRGPRALSWLGASGLPTRLVSATGEITHLNGWPAATEVAA